MKNITICVLFMSFLIQYQALSQECGISAIQQARKLYDVGRIMESIKLLEHCFEINGFTRKEKLEALKPLVIGYVAIDRYEKAEQLSEQILKLDPNFSSENSDPLLFQQLIKKVKHRIEQQLVSSVSKVFEDPNKAPTSIHVITHEEIQNRGYQSIVEILQDIPGFDINIVKGVNYAMIQPRGYRSNLSDRVLFLIDGVEENDMNTDNPWISRQYNMDYIKRVEVVYGPASTMYGANAFGGVVNIITKSPDDMINVKNRWLAKKKNLSIHVDGNYGTFNTAFFDASVAWSKGQVSFISGFRYYYSDEMDLSFDPNWKYQVKDENFYRNKLTTSNTDVIQKVLTSAPSSPLYRVVQSNSEGTPTTIAPTNQGAQRAMEYDRAALNSEVGNEPLSFTNHTEAWSWNAKLMVRDLTFGFQTMSKTEGTIGWFNNSRAGSKNGGVFNQRNFSTYLRYDKYLSSNFFITLFTRFKNHGAGNNSRSVRVNSYYNGRLSLANLTTQTASNWTTTYFFNEASQMRSELRMGYRAEHFNIIAGGEFRYSIKQGPYLTSTQTFPSEEGTVPASAIKGGHLFQHRDIGAYVQISYDIFQPFRITTGFRIDNNKIRESGGYGTEYNYRFAGVYSIQNFIFKGIFSTAFKDASTWTKYATTSSRALPNPTLEPERVNNIEFTGRWKNNEDSFNIELAIFNSSYTGLVRARPTSYQGGTTLQNQAAGELTVFGLQTNLNYLINKKWRLYANYTYLKDIGKNGTLSIPSNLFNLGFNWNNQKGLNINLRGNYKSSVPMGSGTSTPNSPITSVDSYFVANMSISYQFQQRALMGLKLQITANNLLDHLYYHPGIRTADGNTYAPRIPQNTRNITGKISITF